MHIARGLGSGKEPRLVKEDEFVGLLPPIDTPPLSERGELSRERVGGRMTPSHREKVARALLEHYEDLSSEQRIEFSTAKEAGASDFEFDPRKFTDYLFNLEHKAGGPKARFFIDELGISPGDWKFLANQIERGMISAPIYRAVLKTHGFSHGAYVLVTGRNGKRAVLETGWIIEAGQPARFVTAYPGDSEHAESLRAPLPEVVDPQLKGDARWKAIYDLANEVGQASAEAVTPTPMVVQGYSPNWEGYCGSGWARLPDARYPMARWLLRMQKGRKSYPGVDVGPPLQTQSMERNRAYAEAFAQVLKANGVECSVHYRLD